MGKQVNPDARRLARQGGIAALVASGFFVIAFVLFDAELENLLSYAIIIGPLVAGGWLALAGAVKVAPWFVLVGAAFSVLSTLMLWVNIAANGAQEFELNDAAATVGATLGVVAMILTLRAFVKSSAPVQPQGDV